MPPFNLNLTGEQVKIVNRSLRKLKPSMAVCNCLTKSASYLFWWIVFLLLGPFIAFILGLFCFWKILVIEPIAKLAISKRVRRLGPFDSVLAVDDFWGAPLATIGLLLTVDGKVDISEFRRHFTKTTLEATTKDGRPIYKKLGKIPKQFCGYFFWEPCADFKLEEHIIGVDCSSSQTEAKSVDFDETLRKCCSVQMKKAFPNRKPLWDVTIFSNCSDDGMSAVLFRFHHCIADGYTIIKLVDRLTGTKTVVNPSTASFGQLKSLKRGSLRERILSWVGWAHFILRTPSVIVHLYLDNFINPNIFTSRKTSKDFVFSWTSVSLSHLRTIRQRTKTRFATLGMVLLSGSLSKHLETHFPGSQDEQNFRIMAPLPWPNHPTHKMKNHWTMGIAEASQSRDPLERVQKTQANFTKVLNSGAPVWCRLLGPRLLALLPKSILKFILSSNHCNGIIFTSVPGSSEKNCIKMLGQHVVNMIPMMGPQYMRTGVVCLIFTYDGKAYCTITGNIDIMKGQENVDRICQEFFQEEVTSLLLASKEISSDGRSPLLAHQIV